MSETVYTDPALAARKEPFNQMNLRQTAEENAHMQRKTSQTPMKGSSNWINPANPNGGIRNGISLVNEAAKFGAAYKALGAIQDANDAIFERAKKLECDKPFNYNIFYETKPIRYSGIAPSREGFITSTTTEIVPTTIIGTNCSIMKDYKLTNINNAKKKVVDK